MKKEMDYTGKSNKPFSSSITNSSTSRPAFPAFYPGYRPQSSQPNYPQSNKPDDRRNNTFGSHYDRMGTQ